MDNFPKNLPKTLKVSVTQMTESGFSVKTTLNPLLLDADDVGRIEARSPIYVDLKIKPVGTTNLLVDGNLETSLSCVCDHCLGDYEEKIHVDDVCKYFENYDEEIDLTDLIREDILIAFPQNTICRPNCKGLCPQCGVNFNEVTCACVKPLFVEDEPASNIWGPLDSLKLD